MKRFWILAGAFAVTVATLALALLLGSLGFDVRRYSQHERRLARVLEEHPSIERLTRGLEDEGTPVLAAPATPDEVERIIGALGGRRAPDLRDKARRWTRLRVYSAADMLYFVFFDDEGLMSDFVCVSRS